ncbi:MAG: ABC transporter substrate-binding protein [Lachnospiraceae bacterium]|nr:ABC transporter substrate-binding protein [Lachnospiraceae bacterium]
MKKKVLALTVAVLLLVSGSMAGCGAGAGASDDDYVVKIGYFSDLCYAPTHIAIENGFFEAEGLKFEAIRVDPAVVGDSIATNQIDAGMALGAKFIQSLENGLPLKFTSGIHTGCIKIVVPPDSGIASLEDLKGKKIGVSGLVAPPALITMRALAARGIGVTSDNLEVEFIVYSNADLYVALENGAIDAVAGSDPSVTIAEQQYNLTVLLDTAKDEPYKNEYCCLSFVTASLAENHPELAAKYTRALMKASAWVESNPAETARIQVEKDYVTGDAKTNGALLARYSYSPSVQGGYDAISNLVTEFNAIKLLDPSTDTDLLLKNSFVFLEGVD